jgi:hypothetical protein
MIVVNPTRSVYAACPEERSEPRSERTRKVLGALHVLSVKTHVQPRPAVPLYPAFNSHRIIFFAHPHPLIPIESYSYKKQGEECPLPRAKGDGHHLFAKHPGMPIISISSLVYEIIRGRPGGPVFKREGFNFPRGIHRPRITRLYSLPTTHHSLPTTHSLPLKPPLQMAHPYTCTCKKGPAAREPRYSPCAAS